MAPEISRYLLAFIRLCSIRLLTSFQTFCFFFIHFNFSYLLWADLPHIRDSAPFERYPIDSSENNGGSSSVDSFSLTVYSSRSRTLLNTNTHSSPWTIELSYMIMAVPLWPLHLQFIDCAQSRLPVFLKIQTLPQLSSPAFANFLGEQQFAKEKKKLENVLPFLKL